MYAAEKETFGLWFWRHLVSIGTWIRESLWITTDVISPEEACRLITSFEITIKIQPTIVEFDHKTISTDQPKEQDATQ